MVNVMSRSGTSITLEHQCKQVNKQSHLINRRFAFPVITYFHNTYTRGYYETVNIFGCLTLAYRSPLFFMRFNSSKIPNIEYVNYVTQERIFFTGVSYNTECLPETFEWFSHAIKSDPDPYNMMLELVDSCIEYNHQLIKH